MNKKTHQLINRAFKLLSVSELNFKELHDAYVRCDQKLMKSGRWNATNPKLVINKVRETLEEIDLCELEESDRSWCAEILWFWYHHATSCTDWEVHPRLVQDYSQKALDYQQISQPEDKGQPNRITKLLNLLAYGKLEEAKEWMKVRPDSADKVEHQTGLDLIKTYEKYGFI